ncbi:MAG: ethanolamine utilization protein [Dethiosulfovibrio peptidovorans]|nr:MAG: ethanolamine utilization protein [Dethiosulfovibrio peptidovorans]
MRTAIGMIETLGMLGAVEAADSALKCASVSLLQVIKVRGGLVTVCITGDVAAVRAAVDAAAASVTRLKISSTTHVIPRLADQAWPLVSPQISEPEREERSARIEFAVPEKRDETQRTDEPTPEERFEVNNDKQNRRDLESMTVMNLRRLARNEGLTSMTKKEIRFANKAQLIRELRTLYASKEKR